MLAIETYFIGPTNTRGARYVARVIEEKRDNYGETWNVRKVTVQADDSLGSTDNHRKAAETLIRKLEWTMPEYGRWIGGGSVRGYVFVCDLGDRNGAEVIAIQSEAKAIRAGLVTPCPHTDQHTPGFTSCSKCYTELVVARIKAV